MPSPRRYLYGPMLIALVIGGCTESSFEPEGARRLDPPEIYRVWWAEVEACTGVTARFERVNWFEADRLVNEESGSGHVGAWQPPHSIYIQSSYLNYRAGVKHEIVHDLLQLTNHESEMFRLCAGV
jgi:hypothetical protein